MWHTFGHQERAAGSKQGAEYLELLEHSPHGLRHRQPGAHMPPTVPGKADMEDHKVTLDVCGCRLCDNKKSDDSYVVLESRFMRLLTWSKRSSTLLAERPAAPSRLQSKHATKYSLECNCVHVSPLINRPLCARPGELLGSMGWL